MTREKRLSPRRAKSRLPLSPRANSRLRLKPLLFLRPLPLQRRHTECARLARFYTHYEDPFFDARPEGFSELGPPTADVVFVPRRGFGARVPSAGRVERVQR